MPTFDLQEFEDTSRENGIRYWIAHDFMRVLGYESCSSFEKVIDKAMGSCISLNVKIHEAFIHENITIDGREVTSYRLDPVRMFPGYHARRFSQA
uniref:BRO family, N-terminal domain n=1 Tax=Candidatus Kentrum sp. LFY TaxID=2126342 RepID=A0A450UT36_9GAMM|nr:MAG: hypothetical protein BECKLFY1418A_GA0070994_10533 [Candidatus Kentron sp. LFY]